MKALQKAQLQNGYNLLHFGFTKSINMVFNSFLNTAGSV